MDFTCHISNIFRICRLAFCLALMLVADIPASAQTQSSNAAENAETYGGVVVDQTITMIGQEFYQSFTALWREKANVERYTMSIRERPSARQGSQIWIDFGQKRVFQAQLPATRSRVRELSEQAVEATYQNVADTDLQTLLFRDPDLGPDEM